MTWELPHEKYERAIVAEVHRRRCPYCDRPLSGCLIATLCNDHAIAVTFTCAWCRNSGTGEIEITAEISAEIQKLAPQYDREDSGSITTDEQIELYNALKKPPADWWRELTS